MGTTSSATNAIFNGNSRYSQDFQSVITRATAIASLPITQLNNNKTALGKQSDAMKSLDDVFNKLQTAVQGIQGALGGASYEADISDPTKVGVTLGDGAVEGYYTVDVLDPGVKATSVSTTAWNNDAGTHTYKLSVGGKTYDLHPADNSAAAIAAAININFGDKVTAAVIDVGTADAPDQRINLQSTALGDTSPDILKDSGGLQSQKVQGSLANYIVQGQGTGVTSTTSTIKIADGLTVTLKEKTNGTPVNITVTRSSSALTDAITAFTTAYNNAVDAVDKQHGNTGGDLAGNPMVGSLSQYLSQMATFTSSGAVGSLADLGLTLAKDNSGHLEFNSFALLAAGITNSPAVLQFLGSSSSSGFLKSASDLLDKVGGAGYGLLPSAEADVQTQIAGIDSSVADMQAKVDDMTTRMQQQMAAADALIASMEQQYNYLFGMFNAMQTADNQYK